MFRNLFRMLNSKNKMLPTHGKEIMKLEMRAYVENANQQHTTHLHI